MKIEASIEFAELCEQLGVTDIRGAKHSLDGRRAEPGDDVWLTVSVSESEMVCSRCDLCEGEPDYTPPQQGYLTDWIAALLAGDVGLALSLSTSVFEDPATQAICERALLASHSQRRAA